MLNYLKKFAMEILPSVAATIIGAYIVNHYISPRPAPTRRWLPRCPLPRRRNLGGQPHLPQPGVKARGISERP